MRECSLLAWMVGVVLAVAAVRATETEHLNFDILPASGAVKVDGQAGDWDLAGGIFACGDVENAAGKFGVWLHAMYDKEDLYILARWVDPTPMNNRGSIKGDSGFNGDCLQVRIITALDVTAPGVARPDRNANDAPDARTAHLTAWRDRDGMDVIDVVYGHRFNEGSMKDAKAQGAAQAFAAWPDGKGYTQEMAIPWKLLTKPGVAMKPGMQLVMTFEPNFTAASGGRLSIKDLFKPGVSIDRVFTFTGSGSWGYATLAERGKPALRPVRLSDGREFAVRMENGLPAIDWTGLVKSNLPDGFKTIRISMPEDGYASVNLFAPDGSVVRQLLTAHFLPKGEHEIKWDGLRTWSVRRPGAAAPAGDYSWAGFYHTGIGLKLRGWAGNSGPAPWAGWGADHGNPQSVAAAGGRVFSGWGGGEGDKPLLACDPDGTILWKNIRGGIASASPIAADDTTVYAFNNVGQYAAKAVYRVDARTGGYTEWSALKSTDLTTKDLWDGAADAPEQPSALAAGGGRVFVSFHERNTIVVVDAASGKVVKRLTAPKPGAMAVSSAGRLFAVSETQVLAIDVESGQTRIVVKPTLAEKEWISALAVDASGSLYLGLRDRHQVEVYAPDGKLVRTIGRKGGRALLGPWTADGLYNIGGLAVDARNQLWVAEEDGSPRRVSVWDAGTGAFRREFFGASSYGASGAAINPKDPYLMVGQGCEWRIDPQTGRAACVGTITRDGMGSSRFGIGGNGRLYLAITPDFLHGTFPVRIFERLGEADYRLRTVIRQIQKDGPDKKKIKSVEVWSDANDDAQEQPEEVATYTMDLGGWLAGWYLCMTPDLSFYGSVFQMKVTGWTACGAPMYDLNQATKLPGAEEAKVRGGMGAQKGLGSADGRLMLYNGGYGLDHSTVDCYDIATGQRMWTYPSNFTGVHGSHRACGPETGMMRGAYDIVGAAKLPDPIGNIWVIPTNKGEWHVLTERGFYLTRLFEGDAMKQAWPEKATPGASLDTCPPGAGEEAFGGSISQGMDGGLSVQAGHISYWNAAVTGIETIKALPGGKIEISDEDVRLAESIRGRALQAAESPKSIIARRLTPQFTGNFDKDFAGAQIIKYQKQDDTAVRSAIAWDARNLYLGWDVKDPTPWVNGADAPEYMYARGDTVDLQLGADPGAPKDRKDAVLGDLRLSVGLFEGKPTAMIYRKVSAEKQPRTFSSGVVKGYVMESVRIAADAHVQVKVDAQTKRYIVEAAVPLSSLAFTPSAGMVIRGDFGVTHGDAAGRDTVLRTHWSNQNTGLVSDEVFELQLTPANWGEIRFQE